MSAREVGEMKHILTVLKTFLKFEFEK